jgi:hypothetical protein
VATHNIPSGSKGVSYGPASPAPAQTLVNNYTILNNSGASPGSEIGDGAITIYELDGLTLINNGTIKSTYAATGNTGYGILFVGSLAQQISITNAAGGTIEATGEYGIGVLIHGGTIVNAGLISGGSGDYNWGVKIGDAGGYISNASTGTITGGGVKAYSAFTMVNAGKVLGPTVSGAHYGAMYLYAGGSVTNLSSGTIAAENGTYGIKIARGGGTVINAGYIDGGSRGGDAVRMTAGYTNLVEVDPGAKFRGIVDGGATATSTLELGSGASVGTMSSFGSEYINFGTLEFGPSAQWLFQTNTANIPEIIEGFVEGDTINITGFTATSITTLSGNTGVILNGSGGPITVNFAAPVSNVEFTTGAFGTELTTICFCADTMIDTPEGEVPVQTLQSGDMVATAHNGPRKVVWVGQGKVLTTRGLRSAATPVIVRKGALADSVPNRDLHVTKGHSLYIDGVLIPVEFLVNHRSILWDDRAQEVEIYHVELESHDVLIANGALAESYRDDGNRQLFRNRNISWDLPPQAPFAPVLTGGAVVDAVWRRLLDRSGPRHLPPMTDDPDLHLVVDGVRVDAQESHGSVYVFPLPQGARRVFIASREGVPSELGIARDPRSLGVALRRVTIQQGSQFTLFDSADERLTEGFHEYEPADRLRWTNGYAELPVAMFAELEVGAELILQLGAATQYPDDGDLVAA